MNYELTLWQLDLSIWVLGDHAQCQRHRTKWLCTARPLLGRQIAVQAFARSTQKQLPSSWLYLAEKTWPTGYLWLHYTSNWAILSRYLSRQFVFKITMSVPKSHPYCLPAATRLWTENGCCAPVPSQNRARIWATSEWSWTSWSALRHCLPHVWCNSTCRPFDSNCRTREH